MTDTGITLRSATPFDAGRIAALHTRSWRENYAGDMSDAYLAHEAPAERLSVWTDRFTDTRENMRVVLAEDGTELVGFCCLFLDHDPADGTLLDNLHVRADYRGQGVGKQLMHDAAQAVRHYDPSGKLYLWVLQSNSSAMAVYRRLGGQPGRKEHHYMPGTGEEGVTAIAVHFDPPTLLDRTR